MLIYCVAGTFLWVAGCGRGLLGWRLFSEGVDLVTIGLLADVNVAGVGGYFVC